MSGRSFSQGGAFPVHHAHSPEIPVGPRGPQLSAIFWQCSWNNESAKAIQNQTGQKRHLNRIAFLSEWQEVHHHVIAKSNDTKIELLFLAFFTKCNVFKPMTNQYFIDDTLNSDGNFFPKIEAFIYITLMYQIYMYQNGLRQSSRCCLLYWNFFFILHIFIDISNVYILPMHIIKSKQIGH